MAGRLEPVVHSWIKWVTWGIVITIERKANGLFVFLRLNGLCYSIALPVPMWLTSWSIDCPLW